MTTKPKSTWGGRRKGAGPKSAAETLRQIGKVLPAWIAEKAANDLVDHAGYGASGVAIVALTEYAKRIREAQAK